MASKRAHAAMNPSADAEEPVDPSDELMFLALGGGNEVGRSCHIIQYKGKTIMLDAGLHPAHHGFAALPFYDEFDLSTVDLLLVTHFHIDHAASLPYVLAKTNFAGRCYMTHPTKAIYKYIVQDAIRLSSRQNQNDGGSSSDAGSTTQLYDEKDLFSTLPQIQTVSFNTTHTHNGIRFTPYPAGHVLGACMYHIEIAGLKILFTGDYSRENDRHLIPATIPSGLKVDCLITESTFGISTSTPRSERETALLKHITSILSRGGRVLLPVASVGMTQELLLILEEFWSRHADYQKFPIFLASALTKKCMVVYQTYIDSMNANIRSKLHTTAATAGKGPWDFQHVRTIKDIKRFDDAGPCVMLAVPGMMQGGASRGLLEKWAPDPKNGVVITGYNVEGTMAKEIMKEPDAFPALNKPSAGGPLAGKRAGGDERPMVPRRCTVQEFSFAAHVDGQENREFIEEVNAPVVVLVHGERGNMMRMRSRLLGTGKFKVYSPANCEEVRIPFRRAKIAKVVGRLANEIHPPALLSAPPTTSGSSSDEGLDGVAAAAAAANNTKAEDGEAANKKVRTEDAVLMSGVLVQNDHKLSLMSPADLREFAGLNTTTILCRQRITLGAAGLELVKWSLEGAFGEISISNDRADGKSGEVTVLGILSEAVKLECRLTRANELELNLSWEGNASNDAVADAVVAVLMGIESSPAALRKTAHSSHTHSHAAARQHDAFGDETHPSRDDDQTGNWLGEKNGGRRHHPLATGDLEMGEKLTRLLLFLESQFGSENIEPISAPKLPPTPVDSDFDPVYFSKSELARLHNLGIPVPGLEVKVDNLPVAKVWLENLEVECSNRALGERVRAVVERGVEVLGGVGL